MNTKHLLANSLLITGGTGSLGSALCHRLKDDPSYSKIIVYSRGWERQAKLRDALKDPSKFRWFIGDILDKDRLLLALRDVDLIVHAASHKEIVSAEYNPSSAVSVNVTGTENVLFSALQCSVKKTLVVSTDKSVQATTLYGATKKVCESLAVAYNSYAGSRNSRFAVVRYGNVIGSSGSVVPVFLRQRESGSLTVTDPKMSRFWVTMPQAVEFILECLTRMTGGEIFIPHLPSAKVIDIAAAIAPEARIEVVGVRPNEKMHEAMLTPEESRTARDLGWAYVVPPPFPFWAGMTYPTAGSPVPEGWTYTSASATRLSPDELKGMIGV